MFLSSPSSFSSFSSFNTARQRLRLFGSVAFAATVALSGCSTTFPTPTPPAVATTLLNGGNDGLLVPLHVERADQEHARLGLPVQIDGKAVYAVVDTGTQGVRVLKSVLPGTSYPSAGDRTSLPFANGSQVSGAAVTLPVSLVGAKATAMTAQAVDDIRCLPGAKHCVAMDGYTAEFGWAFSGLLGIGAAQPDDSCCTQPLRALPDNIGQRYLMHANFAKPFLVLSPSNSLTTGFTLVPMSTAKDGTPTQWPRGCVQVADKMNFCAPVVFASGSSGMIRIETDTAPNWTGDDEVGKELQQGNYNVALGLGSWVHRYDDAQVRVIKVKPGANRIVIGLMAMQNIDVLFDFQHGQMGLHANKGVEVMTP